MNEIFNRIKNEPQLVVILFTALIVNLAFVFWGADYVMSGNKYTSGDTPGWVDSFLNLLNTGNYTFNLHNKEAYFGRVPGFAFFWGIHYLLVGPEYVYQAVAITHALIGVCCTYLIYAIAMKIVQEKKAALLAALLYVFYPFVIYWLTVSYAETLSVFINLLFINLLVTEHKTKKHYIFLGLLSALAFYTREFMGIVLVVALIYIFLEVSSESIKKKMQNALWISMSFIMLYSLWPMRNYINHDRLIFGRSYNGFNFYNEHLLSYTDWVHCWDNDDDLWVRKAIMDDPIDFPDDVFSSKSEEEYARSLIRRANVCGTSFLYWQRTYKGIEPVFPTRNCNNEIEKGFNELKHSFIRHQPVRFIFQVPLQNLKKAVFKSQLKEGSMIQGQHSALHTLLFAYRTALIGLALLGMALSWRNRKMLPVLSLSLFVYFYICFAYRYVEMRNFVQVDTLLLVPAAYSLFYFYGKGRATFFSSHI